jgi:uroporphyrinogen decarboxylase
MMNSRENFFQMIEGGTPERLPFDLPTTEPVERRILERTGKSSHEAFDLDIHSSGASFLEDDPERWRAAYGKIGFHLPDNSVVLRMGISFVRPPASTLGEAVHLMEMLHPLAGIEEVSQLESLPWPDTSDPANFTGCARRREEIHAAGKVASASLECTVFEDTWYLRGMENVFCDWADENPVTEWLLDYFTERSFHSAQAFARAGFDVIRLGDDIAMQQSLLMSADTWRQHLKPRLKRVIDGIREASGPRKVWVHYHSDGEVTPLIDDLIEAGVDILNPVQPECMDLEGVAARYQDRLAFCGMIGTQTTMPFGSPDDVRAAVERCRRLHENGARVIVAPTHVLEPDVPWENITAFVDAVREKI